LIDKPPELPGQQAIATAEPYVVVPYVDGKLRDQTTDAVMGWGGSYVFHALDPADPYAYARALMDWWEARMDLVVIEHDIVPAPGMIGSLLACAQPWCGHPYHIGEGRYVYGLGLCKVAASVMTRLPILATLAMRNHRGLTTRVPWGSVNEAFEQQMQRCGYTMHQHTEPVEHLHYPVEPVCGD